jgi:hypothetical protein
LGVSSVLDLIDSRVYQLGGVPHYLGPNSSIPIGPPVLFPILNPYSGLIQADSIPSNSFEGTRLITANELHHPRVTANELHHPRVTAEHLANLNNSNTSNLLYVGTQPIAGVNIP